jgi:hypothetical protein
MSNINPIGIDESSGQLKPVGPNDSVVNNIGDQIFVGVRDTGDYSQNSNLVSLVYDWSNPILLSQPASVPPNEVICSWWSPNNEYLTLSASSNDPRLFLYQRVGTQFFKLDNPASIPSGGFVFEQEWTLDGQFLAVTVSMWR